MFSGWHGEVESKRRGDLNSVFSGSATRVGVRSSEGATTLLCDKGAQVWLK